MVLTQAATEVIPLAGTWSAWDPPWLGAADPIALLCHFGAGVLGPRASPSLLWAPLAIRGEVVPGGPAPQQWPHVTCSACLRASAVSTKAQLETRPGTVRQPQRPRTAAKGLATWPHPGAAPGAIAHLLFLVPPPPPFLYLKKYKPEMGEADPEGDAGSCSWGP